MGYIITYKFYNETHVHMNIPYIYILLIHAWRLTHTHIHTYILNQPCLCQAILRKKQNILKSRPGFTRVLFTQVEGRSVLQFTLRKRDYTQISEIVRGITHTDKHTDS